MHAIKSFIMVVDTMNYKHLHRLFQCVPWWFNDVLGSPMESLHCTFDKNNWRIGHFILELQKISHQFSVRMHSFWCIPSYPDPLFTHLPCHFLSGGHFPQLGEQNLLQVCVLLFSCFTQAFPAPPASPVSLSPTVPLAHPDSPVSLAPTVPPAPPLLAPPSPYAPPPLP